MAFVLDCDSFLLLKAYAALTPSDFEPIFIFDFFAFY